MVSDSFISANFRLGCEVLTAESIVYANLVGEFLAVAVYRRGLRLLIVGFSS
jgi:hypothetical protein